MKRGLGEMFVNLMIILLVLAGIVILWYFIKPTVFKGSNSLDGADECLQLDIEPVSCVNLNGSYEVSVRRNSGQVKSLKEIMFVFELPDASTVSARNNTKINELETKTYRVTIPNSDAKQVGVAGVLDIGDGRLCYLSKRISCSQ